MKKALVLSVFLVACGPSRNQESELTYKVLPSYKKSFSGIYSTTKVCIRGPLKRTWNNKIYVALMKWVKPLQSIDEEVSASYVLSCEKPDYDIYTHSSKGRAHASYSGRIDLYKNSTFSTLVHEFGHVFAGLADTYVEGVWSCQPGQPISMMCSSRVGENLMKDDINGVRATFRKNVSMKRPVRVFQKIVDKMARLKQCSILRGLKYRASASLSFSDGRVSKAYINVKTDRGSLTLTSYYLQSSRVLYSRFSREIWDFFGDQCPEEI